MNEKNAPFVKNDILGVEVSNARTDDVLKYVFTEVVKKKNKIAIVTPNPEIIILANKNPQFKNLLNQAQISLPDGVGIIFAGRILHKEFKERIPGTDFMELICRESIGKPVSIGFFGGKKGIAKKASECLTARYPGVHILYAVNESEQDMLVKKPVDVLFVGLGAPKQEEFIFQNLPTLPVTIAMGVGGAFDFFSGSVPRAPQLLRNLGLEWLYRLIRQPWRAKRQLALMRFICLIMLARLRTRG